MTNRPDIGYGVTNLSKFYGAPFSDHFELLKQFDFYLQDTAH